MQIVFISSNYPPEVNAPAIRLQEHARHWVKEGHNVEVVTGPPSFPEGVVYEGYRNRFSCEVVEGIGVTRVPMYVSPNTGILRRTLGFVSFMVSVRWNARRLRGKPDIVVATSPQFFAGIAGYLLGRYFRVPFVLEIRDLWPESIVAVGAMKRNGLIRFFERLERFLYARARHLVVVTDAFKRVLIEKGVPSEKIDVLKNGADLEAWHTPVDAEEMADLRRRHGFDGKFVAGYIGTIGMAHGVEILYEAARRCPDPDVVFLVVGTGADRWRIEQLQAAKPLANLVLLEKASREEVRYLYALCDVNVVHLKAVPLFETVIPSKIFEAMVTRTPIALGVRGEARAIVEEAGAGLYFEPENAEALVQVVLRLKNEPALHAAMAGSGYEHVCRVYDRSEIAHRYAALLEHVAFGTIRTHRRSEEMAGLEYRSWV